jgi:hypothetical protein
MTDSRRLLWLVTGLLLGVGGTGLYLLPSQQARAANDRYEDYILCTGAAWITPRAPTDGVWLLDYRTGRLLATVIDRANGKIVGWAELDMVAEFGLKPRDNVHFMMTTGSISQGQAALYIAETNSAKFGVYTMAPRLDGQSGVAIVRHDLELFRQVAQQAAN